MAKKRGAGEGTIYQRSDGRWSAQLTLEIEAATRKQKRITVYGKTKKEVLEKLTSIKHQKQTGNLIKTEKIMLAEWLDYWATEYRKASLRQKTWESYDWLIRVHIKPVLGNILLNKVQPGDIQRFYNDRLANGRLVEEGGVSTRTVRYIHTILNGAFKQAVKDRLVLNNPVELVTPPKNKTKEIQILSQEQIKQFLSAARTDRFYPSFLLELGTGLRRGELLGLKWEDINLERGLLHVRRSLVTSNRGLLIEEPKTMRSKRCIPLPTEVTEILKQHKENQDEEKKSNESSYTDLGFVFCWEDGRLVDPNNFSRRFSKILERAELPHVTLHSLRHRHASDLLLLGENPKVVQERLGHCNIGVTMDIYSHVTMGMQEVASAKINTMLKEFTTKCP